MMAWGQSVGEWYQQQLLCVYKNIIARIIYACTQIPGLVEYLVSVCVHPIGIIYISLVTDN